MELHASSFLSCPRVARWLTDVSAPASAHKELLGAARTLHVWRCPPPPLGHAAAPSAEAEVHTYVVADVCEQHGHVLCFATGAVLGKPNDALYACPTTTRLAIDLGRRAVMMFEHADDGSTTVALDCFDEAGDSCADVRYFAPRSGAPAYSFPETLASASKVLRRRDCPSCTKTRRSCECAPRDRLDKLLSAARRSRVRRGKHCYPAWQQALDAYVDSRIGAYVVQAQHTPVCTAGSGIPPAYKLAYRARYANAPAEVCERRLREIIVGGVTPLLPRPCGDAYHGPSTCSVNAHNIVSIDRVRPLVDDWRKLPGLQYDYLLSTAASVTPEQPPELRVVHCEDASNCPQPGNICASFGALLQPSSVAAECGIQCGGMQLHERCKPKPEVKPNRNMAGVKLCCDEPENRNLSNAQGPKLSDACDWHCKPSSDAFGSLPTKSPVRYFNGTQVHCNTLLCSEPPAPAPGKRPRGSTPPPGECSGKRICTDITPQAQQNCTPSAVVGRCTTASPSTSWDDLLSGSSHCANATECCPPVPVRDEWELPSRTIVRGAAAPSVVCAPSIRVDLPPSPRLTAPTHLTEPVDTITGDVQELCDGVRESNQKAQLKWLARETPIRLLPSLTL